MDTNTLNTLLGELAMKGSAMITAFILVGGILFFEDKIKHILYRSVK